MIKFKTLSIKNFLSYGESPTVIDLNNVGTTLIIGEDLDNTAAGIGGNGTGKTTWVNALIFGLYGKPISNISLDNLVNNINKKNMLVEVEFEKDGKIILIRRARKEKGNGNYAKVFIRPIGTDLNESKHDKTPDSINNINDFIIDHLGIPYELFVRIVAFAATHTPFLDLPVRHSSQANQSDIMEELFRLTQLSVKAESLKVVIRDTKQTLEIKIKHNEQLKNEHERHNKQLESAKNRVNNWKEDQKENVKITENKLTKYKAVPIKEQEELYKRVDELKETLIKEKEKQNKLEIIVTDISTKFTVAKTHLSVVEIEKDKILSWKKDNTNKITKCKTDADLLPKAYILTEQKNLHNEIESLTKDLHELKENENKIKLIIENINEDLNKINKELVHLKEAKCPYCLQQYKNAKKKIDECKKIIDTKSKKHTESSILLKVIQNNIKSTEKNIKVISNDIKYSINEVTTNETMRDNYVKRLEELFNEKCPYEKINTISELNNTIIKLKEEKNQFKEKISNEAEGLIEIDKSVEIIIGKIEECKDEIIISSLDELYEIKNKISQYKIKVKELKNEINPYLEPLKELEDIKIEPINMNNINKLNELITHQNYLVKLLTKKDSFIRKKLLTRNISFLNQRLRNYLIALGLPHKVEFTHEMTANISQFGRQLDFGNLSSGQKARVNLGLSFSFRDVLQKSHDSINVCMLDEVLDVGLDSVGVQNAANMLKNKARDENLALYIISHRDEVSNIFDNKMIVQMEKGFSSVKK